MALAPPHCIGGLPGRVGAGSLAAGLAWGSEAESMWTVPGVLCPQPACEGTHTHGQDMLASTAAPGPGGFGALALEAPLGARFLHQEMPRPPVSWG